MGLIILRHAYSRYLNVKPQIESTLPKRGGKIRPPAKEDSSGRGAIYLRNRDQYDYLVNLSDADDWVEAIMHTMEVIEEDYESPNGILPKREYQELDYDVLGTPLGEMLFEIPIIQYKQWYISDKSIIQGRLIALELINFTNPIEQLAM